MTQELPQLIKEKLNFYIYFKSWRMSIKRLNSEYKIHISKLEYRMPPPTGWKRTYICWMQENNPICEIKGKINHIEEPYITRLIGNFTRTMPITQYKIYSLRKKYYYSSGKMNPNGYNNKIHKTNYI